MFAKKNTKQPIKHKCDNKDSKHNREFVQNR